jgi:hypothetical protein
MTQDNLISKQRVGVLSQERNPYEKKNSVGFGFVEDCDYELWITDGLYFALKGKPPRKIVQYLLGWKVIKIK